MIGLNIIYLLFLFWLYKFYKMFQSSNNSSGMKLRIPSTQPKFNMYQSISFKNSGTQTSGDTSCQIHSQQITELLTEVAIILGHKAKLENEIVAMKEEFSKVNKKSDETRLDLEQQLEKLKKENLDKDMELSKLKIIHLEEQRDLLTQVNHLKNRIQIINEEKDMAYQNFEKEREQLEIKININQGNLMKEAEKNVYLQQKVTKYKYKLKYMISYIQELLLEFKEKQNKKIEANKPRHIKEELNSPNMEELVLNELFFKPSPLPEEVADLFFQHK